MKTRQTFTYKILGGYETMKEQNEKEQELKKEKKSKKKISGEKRFYMLTALGCAAALVAIVVVAVAVSASRVEDNQVSNNPPAQSTPLPDSSDTNGEGGNKDDEQVSGLPEGMVSPLETVTVLNDYGFYHNKTLNAYYEHKGVDFSAAAGTNVLAVESGVVESVYKDDILLGTEITIDHGNGLKSVYCYVTEVEGLKAGDSVEKGAVIATVAEANGKEYKDGAHLHFEIIKEGKSVDPASYLTLEEK